MADFTIEAQPRTVVGKKVHQLRVQGLVPCTVYGPKIQAFNIQIPYRPLEVALSKAGGTNLIDLNVDGVTHSVLARYVQRDSIRRTIEHIDFFAVDLMTKIRTLVPVHLMGESPIVTQKRGVLLAGASNIMIEVLPSALLHYIEVDLTKLRKFGDSITVGDLDLGEGITILNEPEEMIAKILQPSAARSAEEEA
ncbi:MAG: 50S ribosomal protein L25, partial [Armatimonadetes bacterium]|nr:50S ribosomal protein L25 [Anaerolineae bacterium]